MMFKPEVIKQKKGENRRSENSRNTRCYHKTSKKCQGKTITGTELAWHPGNMSWMSQTWGS